MNRNQKIALGCGGGGCLGLIVVVAIGVFIYLTYVNSTTYNGNRNTNFSVNTNRSTNANTATEESSSMSEDDKHKLFQAAGITRDGELIQRVLRKIGFRAVTDSGYEKFSQEHLAWGMKNLDFIQSVNTPAKARAYVEAHIDD